jgi:hypothetical protein
MSTTMTKTLSHRNNLETFISGIDFFSLVTDLQLNRWMATAAAIEEREKVSHRKERSGPNLT